MDESQVYDDAHESLRAIIAGFPNEPISLIAGSLLLQLRPPTVTKGFPNRDNKGPEGVGRVMNTRNVRSLAVEAEKVIKKKNGPEYKTPVFKCLDDFNKCKNSNSSSRICKALFYICVGKQLLPFVK